MTWQTSMTSQTELEAHREKQLSVYSEMASHALREFDKIKDVTAVLNNQLDEFSRGLEMVGCQITSCMQS